MTLRQKALLWISILFLLTAANAAIGILTLRDFNRITTRSAQEYEVTSRIRRLRSLLFGYHSYVFSAALTGNGSDGVLRDIYREALEIEADSPPPEELEPHHKAEIAATRDRVRRLLEYTPRAGENSDPIVTSPAYRSRLRDVEQAIEALLSSLEVEQASAQSETARFYQRGLIILFLSLVTSVVWLVIGTLHLRSHVLLPFGRIRRFIESINAGDLAVRWTGSTRDEIGEIGTTLNRLTRQLEERRKERIEMIGAVAHDLKNPLSTLSLECQMLKRHPARLTPDRVPEVMARIERQIEKLWRLSEDLLQTAKEASAKWQLFPSEFQLVPLALETLRDFRMRHRDHTYRYSGPASEMPLVADRVRIAQVLENLVSNATKYSPPGTEIELKLEDLGADIEIQVLDRGIGIPDERRHEVFRSFSRVEGGREVAHGTGLGLAICREIVELHGGIIGVNPRRGGGSVFRVLLPKHPPTSAQTGELGRVA